MEPYRQFQEAVETALAVLKTHAHIPACLEAFLKLYEAVQEAKQRAGKVKSWVDNTALEPLVICGNAAQLGTTYERLCYHMVHHHSEGAGFVSGRGQEELERWHDRKHSKEYATTPGHSHRLPVRTVGYEPMPRPEGESNA